MSFRTLELKFELFQLSRSYSIVKIGQTWPLKAKHGFNMAPINSKLESVFTLGMVEFH